MKKNRALRPQDVLLGFFFNFYFLFTKSVMIGRLDCQQSTRRMHDKWREIIVVLFYKNKEGFQNRTNYF